jgi:hypothetical protein
MIRACVVNAGTLIAVGVSDGVPSKVTFAGKSPAEMNAELDAAEAALSSVRPRVRPSVRLRSDPGVPPPQSGV